MNPSTLDNQWQCERRNGSARGLEFGQEFKPESGAFDERVWGGENTRGTGYNGEQQKHEATIMILWQPRNDCAVWMKIVSFSGCSNVVSS